MGHPTLSRPAKPAFLNEKQPWVMGVLNTTPDSFYPNSRTTSIDSALLRAEQMITEGADVLDVGGESTRPGATDVPAAEELDRILPVISALRARFPNIPLSIDTRKASVAREALAQGASVVNDVSALQHDPEMVDVLADSDCAVVLMHMQGTPKTMQIDPHYVDVVDDIKRYLESRIAFAVGHGIREDRIVIDPGIGFGKTLEHNVTILQNVSAFKALGRPILVGLSRKGFIGRLLAREGNPVVPPEQRLHGTLAATVWAVQQGANGVRVHDVAATRQTLNVLSSLQTA